MDSEIYLKSIPEIENEIKPTESGFSFEVYRNAKIGSFTKTCFFFSRQNLFWLANNASHFSHRGKISSKIKKKILR